MNSSKLKECFSEVYSSFFRDYEIVTAANYSMPWSNEMIDHASNFPLVRTKLPLRCYVGIRRISEPEIRFVAPVSYLGETLGFKQTEWTEFYSNQKETKRMILERFVAVGYEGGIEIGAVCEVVRGRSIGFTETFSAALAYGIRVLLAEKERPNEEYKTFSADLNDEQKRELIDFAWNLSIPSRNGNTIGQGVRNSVEDFGGPVVYFGEVFDNLPIDVAKLGRWQKKLSESSGWVEKFPIDSWIVYSGVPGNTNSIEEMRQSDAIETERLGQFLHNLSESCNTQEYFFNIGREFGFSAFRNVKKYLNFRGMELLERIGRYGWADDSAINRFIENVNDSRSLLSMVSEQGMFATRISEEVRRLTDVKFGITPLYSGKHGGSYLVVAPRGTIRAAVKISVGTICKDYAGAEVLYSSHEDGDSTECIEVLKNQLSDARSKGRRILLLDNFGNRKHCGYLEALSRKEGEILFDSISRKIYYNGKRLTSKEIPTQNATGELFKRLIEQSGKEIPNRDLPASSYSQNRNEMVSKIISPITKFVKLNTEDELPLRCLGSMTEFRIVLEKTNLRLGLIKHEESEPTG